MVRKILAIAVVLTFCMGGHAVSIAAEEGTADKKFGQNAGDFLKPVAIKYAESDKSLDTGSLSKKSLFILVSSVCSACRQEMSEISANMKYFKDYDLYAVIIDMDPQAAVPRIKTTVGEGVTLLADSKYDLGSKVNMVSAPSTLILDKDGRILYKHVGYGSGLWKEYVAALEK